jgi:hypothetical protein
VNSINSGDIGNDSANITPLIISSAVLLFVYSILREKNIAKDGINLFCLHALLIACAVNLCRLGMPGVVGRLALYFNAPLCALLPNVCESIENKYLKFGCYFLIFSCYSFLCYRSLNYGFELNLF